MTQEADSGPANGRENRQFYSTSREMPRRQVVVFTKVHLDNWQI